MLPTICFPRAYVYKYDDSQPQAAVGIGVAAAVVAVLYYDPQGENGYYYAAGNHMPGPPVDYEKFRQIKTEKESDEEPSEETVSSNPTEKAPNDSFREASRAPAMAPDKQEFEYNWTRSDIGFDDVAGYYDINERLAEEVLQPVQAAARGDDRYDRFGIEPSRRILFYGPPGTGKTMFA